MSRTLPKYRSHFCLRNATAGVPFSGEGNHHTREAALPDDRAAPPALYHFLLVRLSLLPPFPPRSKRPVGRTRKKRHLATYSPSWQKRGSRAFSVPQCAFFLRNGCPKRTKTPCEDPLSSRQPTVRRTTGRRSCTLRALTVRSRGVRRVQNPGFALQSPLVFEYVK